MSAPEIWSNTRVRSTPFTSRIEAFGVGAYTVYNHMLLPLKFVSIEDDYWHLKEHVQLWDVSVQRQVEIVGPDASRVVQLMTHETSRSHASAAVITHRSPTTEVDSSTTR